MKFQVVTISKDQVKFGRVSGPSLDAAAEHGAGSNDWGDYGMLIDENTTYDDIKKIRQRLKLDFGNNLYLKALAAYFVDAMGGAHLRVRTQDKKVNNERELYYYRACKTVFEGVSLNSQRKEILKELLISGECFGVRKKNGKIKYYPAAQCGSGQNKVEEELHGIIYKDGVPTHYKFGTVKKGKISFAEEDIQKFRAENVIHFCGPEKFEGRGVPICAAIAVVANDLYQMTHAKSHQVKTVTDHVAAIYVEQPDEFSIKTALRGRNDTKTQIINGQEVPVPKAPEVDANTDRPVVQLGSGTAHVLKTGERVEWNEQKYNASDFTTIVDLYANLLGSILGINAELYLMGFKNLTYAGWKGLGTHWQERRKSWLEMIREKIDEPIYKWVIDYGTVNGDIAVYDGQDEDQVYFTYKSANTLDPERAAKAYALEIENGSMSWSEALARDGKWLEEVVAERIAEYSVIRAACELAKVPIEYVRFGRLPEVPVASPAAPTPALDLAKLIEAIKEVTQQELTPEQAAQLEEMLNQ